jgi:hypothetical protein
VQTASPLRHAVLCQLAGWLVAGGGAWLWLWLWRGSPLPLPAWVLLQAGVAMLVAMALGLPRWWWLISLLFSPLVVLALGLGVPPWVWLLAFILLLLVFWRTDASRVPLYMSNAATARALSSLLPAGPCRVIDLGCGDGSLLRHLARARPDSQFVGLEHAPLTWAWAWLMGARLRNLDIRYGSFWRCPLTSYQLVYAFLSPVPMPRLWDKVCAELAPGALLVSNSFEVPGHQPTRVLNVGDGRQARLLVYRAAGAGLTAGLSPPLPDAAQGVEKTQPAGQVQRHNGNGDPLPGEMT